MGRFGLRATGLGMVALALAGCNRHDLTCDAPEARTAISEAIKTQIEQAVESKGKKEDGTHVVGNSKVRAALAQLVIVLDDVRTSKTETGSTKLFCAATARINFPSTLFNDAAEARQRASLNTADDLADQSNVDHSGGGYSTALDYTVQRTDDGQKVVPEIQNGHNLTDFAGEIVLSGLMRELIDTAQGAVEAQQQQQKQAQDAATAEQRVANLNAAKVDDQLANQQIAAAWHAMEDSDRARLLPQQRAWIRQKQADCDVEAAAASIDPSEKETARLTCDARTTRARIDWLGQQTGAGNTSTMNATEDGN